MVQTPSRNSIQIFIDKGYLASLYIIALTLPIRPTFLHNVLSYSTILFLIFSLSKVFYNKEFHFRKNLNSILLFCSLFTWWTIGVLYSTHADQAFKYMETKLGLFLIPFFLLILNPISQSEFRKLLKVFALGVTFYLVLSYVLVIIQNYNYNAFEHVIYPFYLYHSLVHFIGMHATYMAIQVALSILIVLDISLSEGIRNTKSIWWKLLWIVFLIFVLISLTVKMIVLAFVFSIIIYAFFKLGFSSSLKIIAPIFLVFVLSVAVLSSNSRFGGRIGINEKNLVQDFSFDPENKNGSWGSWNMRYALAKTSLDVIKENLIFGTGIGDEKVERRKSYTKNDFQFALNKDFNEHNQYLNVLLNSGLIGFIIFLALLIYPMYKAIKVKNALYIAFVVLIMISFLSENYLSRQIGVVFFAYFHTLFWQDLLLKNKTIQSNSV